MEASLYSINFYQTYCVPGTVLGPGTTAAHSPEEPGVVSWHSALGPVPETFPIAKKNIPAEVHPTQHFSGPRQFSELEEQLQAWVWIHLGYHCMTLAKPFLSLSPNFPVNKMGLMTLPTYR